MRPMPNHCFTMSTIHSRRIALAHASGLLLLALCSLLGGLPQPALAQLFTYRHIGVEDGLSHNIVYRVFQHPETHYLWFGTQGGLNRFNGSEIQPFGRDISARQAVLAISEADDKAIRVGFFEGGIYQVGVHADTSTRQENTAIKRPIKMEKLPDGRLLVLTSVGRCLYALGEHNEADTFFHPKTRIRDFAIAPEGEVYVITSSGLMVIAGDSAVQWMHSPNLSTVVCHGSKVYVTQGNKVMLAYRERTEEAVTLGPGTVIDQLMIDSGGGMWCVLRSTSLVYATPAGVHDLGQLLGKADLVVQDMLEDSEGNIWIATRGHGVYSFQVLSEATDFTGLSTENLYLKSGGQLRNGSFIIGGDNSLFSCHDGHCSAIQPPFPEVWFTIYDIAAIGNQAFIASNQGLNRYDGTRGVLEQLIEATVVTLSAPPNSTGALFYATIDGKVFLRDMQGATHAVFECHSRPQVSACDSHSLYVVADGQMYIYRLSDQHLRVVNTPEGFVVHDAALDHSGVLWFATNSGVYAFNGTSWHGVPPPAGSEKQPCYSLAVDGQNQVWVGMLSNITRIQQTGNRVSAAMETVIPPKHLNRQEVGLISIGTDGRLYVGSNTRFFSVPTPSHPLTMRAPHLVLEKIALGNGQRHPEQTTNTPELAYNAGNLQITYDIVSLSKSKRPQVEYRLRPMMNDWTKTNDKTIAFASLPSASYVFEMRIPPTSGSSADETFRFDFSVATPWWSSAWARVALIALIAAGVFILTRVLNRYQRRKYQRKSDMEMLKMRALNNHLNPHFLSNALSSIKHLLRLGKVPSAIKYIGQFAYLLRKNLEHMSSNMISIREETHLLETYLSIEQLRFEDHFRYRISTSPQLDPDLPIPFMIVQPFVENAIWHGLLPLQEKGSGLVEVRFDMAESHDQLCITITDNGVGFSNGSAKEPPKARSSGIATARQRLSIIGNDTQLNIQSPHSSTMHGTQVEIRIPLDH